MSIKETIDKTIAELPDGWQILIEIGDETAAVLLYTPDGDEWEYPSNHESFEQDIEDALDAAIYLKDA